MRVWPATLLGLAIISSGWAKPARAETCGGSSFSIEVGQTHCLLVQAEDNSKCALLFRYDSGELEDKLPDTYAISVKDVRTGTVLLNHTVLKQHSSIRAQTSCGEMSIGADVRNNASIWFNVSFF